MGQQTDEVRSGRASVPDTLWTAANVLPPTVAQGVIARRSSDCPDHP